MLARPRTIALGAGALIAGAVLGALASTRGGRSRPKRVALIGDSMAVGLGPAIGALAARDLVPFRYHGVVGTTPKQWAQSAAACGVCATWIASFAPSDTLVVLGTNDMGGTPAPIWYVELRDALERTGTRVVWVEPPDMPRDPLTAVRAIIEGLGVQVVRAARIPIGPDRVHPTPTGFQQWAWQIWGAVT